MTGRAHRAAAPGEKGGWRAVWAKGVAGARGKKTGQARLLGSRERQAETGRIGQLGWFQVGQAELV